MRAMVTAFLFVLPVNLWAQSADPPVESTRQKGPAVRKQSQDDAKAKGWVSCFDGKRLGQWVGAKGYDYEEHPKVAIRGGCLVLGTGKPATGIKWKGKFPRTDFEITLEAQRTAGSDFFCGMTFPAGKGSLTLILGGWGGEVVGLSSIDGFLAVDNETCQGFDFENKKWYRIRVKVTPEHIGAWIGDNEIVDLVTEGHKFSVSEEMAPCLPFGFATWNTTGSLRNIRYRKLDKSGK